MRNELPSALNARDCDWYEAPDGRLIVEAEHGAVVLEPVEKRAPYRLEWSALFGREEEHLLVLEELAARRLLRGAPYAFLLVSDQPGGRYAAFSVVDLFCMPKRRVERMGGGVWLLDLRDGHLFGSLPDAVAWCLDREREPEWYASTACYRRFSGEEVPER